MDTRMLDLYTDYLLVSTSQASATGMSRMLDGGLSHDQITRFLSKQDFDSKEMWRISKAGVRELEGRGRQGFLILDDSVEAKPYSKENELVCWHYDHTVGKSVKGVNQLTSLYYSDGVSIPVGFDLVLKDGWETDKKGKNRRKATVSKNELFRNQIGYAKQNLHSIDYILADSWFCSAENMRFIHAQCGFHFIMPLKKHRKVALSASDKEAGKYKRLDALEWQEGKKVRIYLEQVDFGLWLTKATYQNKDGSVGELYLVTSDPALDAEQIKEFYAYRWNIEVMYKSVKSNASYAKCPASSIRAQSNHLFCATLAFYKLEQIKIKTNTNHFALKAKLYLPALKTAFAYLEDIKAELGIRWAA